jgi:hypothetical protein
MPAFQRGGFSFTLKLLLFCIFLCLYTNLQLLSPDDKVVPNYLKKIAVWEKEQDKKMANTYSKMFQS